MTPQQAKAALQEKGVNITEWAKEHGFTLNVVYRVLNARAPGLRGEAHRIAVALGIKNPGAVEGRDEHV